MRFRRPEGRAALERYTTGLLTELPNKNCDTLAQAVPGTSEQRLQEFLTKMQWDEEDLNRQGAKMIAEVRGRRGVGRRRYGLCQARTASVGVERQYSGTLGKVGNCQVAVTCCYTDPQATGRWPYGCTCRRRGRTTLSGGIRRGCPRRSRFKPSRDCVALLDQARAWGVPHCCVVADADYGDNPNFLAGLEARQEPYVVAVRTDFPVSVGRTVSTPVWRADELLQTVPRWQWRTIRWRQGPKGGCARSLSRYVVGASPVLGTATRAGWWGSVRPGVARGAEIFLE